MFLAWALRAIRTVVADGRIPRPLRWGGAVGLLPIPGPIDEIVLLFVGSVLWLFYRDQLVEAWNAAARTDKVGHASSSAAAGSRDSLRSTDRQ